MKKKRSLKRKRASRDSEEHSASGWVESGWTILTAAGGLNNEMLFSERIEDATYRSGGHIGFLTTYINSKLAASQYDLVDELMDFELIRYVEGLR